MTSERSESSSPIFVGSISYWVCSEFGLAFLDAKERCNARTRHGTFDTSVLEINKDDLKVFLETLCEGGERY